MNELKALSQQLPQVWLRQGELFVARERSLVVTILGSCVTICLFHPHKVAGAMCHCQLPSTSQTNTDSPYRYVDRTLPVMVAELAKLGAPAHQLKAKLFGGAMVTATRIDQPLPLHKRIGPNNVTMARQLLDQYNIPVVAECVGGKRGYKLYFDSATGTVYLSRLKKKPVDLAEIQAGLDNLLPLG